MRETRKRERMGRRELLSKLPTGVTLPMHATPAIVSTQHLPAGSSNSRRRTSLSVFAYFKQKETLPQIWTLLKCLQLQSFVQEWPRDNIREKQISLRKNGCCYWGVASPDKQGRGWEGGRMQAAPGRGRDSLANQTHLVAPPTPVSILLIPNNQMTLIIFII